MHRSNRKGFTLVELLVVIGIIALLIAILLPSLNRARESANRVRCSSNMRQIGLAILMYANENGGQFPRTPYVQGVNASVSNQGYLEPNPFESAMFLTGAARNNVPAALFLLLRTQDLPSSVFNCPSADVRPDDFDGLSAQQRSNWTRGASVGGRIREVNSYSYSNPYPDAAAAADGFRMNNTRGSDFPIVADMNPGVPGTAESNVTTPRKDSSTSIMKLANSLNHKREGQNVMYADAHVEWHTTAFAGVGGDNIYTRAAVDASGQPFSDGRPSTSPAWWNGPGWRGDAVMMPTSAN